MGLTKPEKILSDGVPCTLTPRHMLSSPNDLAWTIRVLTFVRSRKGGSDALQIVTRITAGLRGLNVRSRQNGGWTGPVR